jgi:hypothetical protein
MRTTLVLVSVLVAGCDRILELDPDAHGPTVIAVWDPKTCTIDPRARVEVRLEDRAGASVLGDAPCAAFSLALAVPHHGWYWASALAMDGLGNGRAFATATLVVDQPATHWIVPWQDEAR